MPEALPLLEHLNVTIEQPQKNLRYKFNQSTAHFELCEEDLRRANANGTKLRSLVLRLIELDDVLVLLNSLTFPLLEKLTLVDVYDRCKCNESFLIFSFFLLAMINNLKY
jgi:hypothetical protein